MRQSFKIGTVVDIKVMGHGLRHMYIKLECGEFEVYLEEFKDTYNKSLKVNDQVKVKYRFSNFVNSNMSLKPTKIKQTKKLELVA